MLGPNVSESASDPLTATTPVPLIDVPLSAKGTGEWAAQVVLSRKRALIDRGFSIPGVDLYLEKLQAGGVQMSTWRVGKGPLVFLTHGADGYAEQYSYWVKPLVDSGYTVVLFDAPGHGRTPGQFATAASIQQGLMALIERFGQPEVLIAHSAGAPGALMAMKDGLTPTKAVFIAPPSNFSIWVEAMAERMGLAEPAKVHFRESIESITGHSIQSLNMTHFSDLMTFPLLICHDRQDRLIPVESGQFISKVWPGARLILTDGLGHGRILMSKEVISASVDFIRGN